MENINKYLMESFEIYKNNKDYEKHKDNLNKLSEYKLLDTINMGSLSLPNIGPDEKIKDFYKTLEDWDEEDIIEVKYLIKLYSGEDIENINEAITIIDVLLSSDNNYKDILVPIRTCLLQNKEVDENNLINLLNYENLLLSNLFTFLTT